MFGMQIGRMGQTRFATWDQIVATMYQNGQVGGNLSFTDFSKIWQDSAGTTPYTAVEQYVGKIIDKSPNALVFTQATSAARPVVSARVNLLTKTEQFDDGVWVKDAGLVTPAAYTSPTGQVFTKYTPDMTAVTNHRVRQSRTVPAGVPYTLSFDVKAAGYTGIKLRATGAWVNFNLTTGAVGNSANVSSPTITALDDGIYRVSATFSVGASICYIYVDPSDTASPDTGAFAGDGTSGIYFRRASLTLSTDAHLPYQRVNTATDYDTVGFPHYLKFDGIDDNLVSAAGGGGIAGIYFCGAIQFSKVGAMQTILSDAGTNSGYKLQLTAANQIQISAGNGTAYTTINTANTFAVGDVALCEFWDDGTNLGVRLGEGTPATVARPVVTAGTAQITIGKDNNAASGYAGISMFEPVWRYGAMPNTTQREAIRAICRSKAGIV